MRADGAVLDQIVPESFCQLRGIGDGDSAFHRVRRPGAKVEIEVLQLGFKATLHFLQGFGEAADENLELVDGAVHGLSPGDPGHYTDERIDVLPLGGFGWKLSQPVDPFGKDRGLYFKLFLGGGRRHARHAAQHHPDVVFIEVAVALDDRVELPHPLIPRPEGVEHALLEVWTVDRDVLVAEMANDEVVQLLLRLYPC